LALAAVVLLSTPPAWGQYSAVIAACRFDAKGVCGGALPEGGQLAACIKRNFPALGEPCKAALVRIAAVRQACAADLQQQCGATRPGAGRILFCVKAHYAELSEPCREAIGHAAERNVRH
jgi:hypothetical protein